jgi:hypothetical protein
MQSPAQAIAWEIWARNRPGFLSILLMLMIGPLFISALRTSDGMAGVANPVAYSLTALALLMTFACFHFTEGQKKGGFGGFPGRLFNLPLRTRSLVAWPMLYGSAVVILVFLLCAGLLLRPAWPNLPLLWPALYLVFGLTQFQMILWSLPESRYLKLLCLSLAASVITFGWMFFVPTIVAGALSEWGYRGDPGAFMRALLLVLALTGPAAYAISLRRVDRQRHRRGARSGKLSASWKRLSRAIPRRRTHFRSADHALFWQDWRRTGYILPTVLALIIALTCVPAWISGGLSGPATMGLLSWLFAAPFLFALIIGRGFGKPDFWSTELKLPIFNSILPLTPGQWVNARLKAALCSAILAWALTLYLVFIWTAFVGELEMLVAWWSRIPQFYSPAEFRLLGLTAIPAVVMVTWSLLIAGLAAGLSGNRLWYRLVNLLTGAALVALFILVIWRSDHGKSFSQLHSIATAASNLPILLVVALILKLGLAAFAWHHAIRRRLTSPRPAAGYFASWLLAVGILELLAFVLSRESGLVRQCLMPTAVLIVPLAGPALAMRSFAANRSRSRGQIRFLLAAAHRPRRLQCVDQSLDGS